MLNQLERYHRLKTITAAVFLVVLGLMAHLGTTDSSWIKSAPLIRSLLDYLSNLLLVTGGLGVILDYLLGRDRDAAQVERSRTVLRTLIPDFRDAVIDGFHFRPEDLKRIATPQVLDEIAVNVLGLRLGDAEFAGEIYADVRDQAIRAPERWHDVQVSVRLSNVELGPATVPRFDVLIEWEYTVRPSHAVARFACVSNRDQFYELVTDVPATLTWFLTPRPGFDATEQSAFELLSLSVDGEERKIRRSVTKTSQTYSAAIGQDVVDAGEPVRIRHVYRTIAAKESHQLFLEMPQPARDVSLEMDYTATDIAEMRVSDLVTSIQKPRISRLPEQVPAKVINVDIPGWLLPRAGFTFGWTLASEVTAPAGPRPGSADARRSA